MEKWLPVVGYEGCYEVSDQGRVKSVRRFVENGRGGWRLVSECIRKSQLNNMGYPLVKLNVGGKKSTHTVHKLVARAFLGECPKGHEIAHLDNTPKNPVLSNLKYVTPKINCSHKVLHGTQTRGSLHPLAKLTEMDVEDIHTLWNLGATQKRIAKEFQVSPSAISFICRGVNWAHMRQ